MLRRWSLPLATSHEEELGGHHAGGIQKAPHLAGPLVGVLAAVVHCSSAQGGSRNKPVGRP